MNVTQIQARQAAQLVAAPHQHGALTRRQFLQTGATAAALATASSLALPQTARAASRPVHALGSAPVLAKKSPADPKPIPYGTPFLYPDPTIFHVQAPGYPLPNPPFDTDPATNDPSTIYDFNGSVGLAYVGGQGTHHDRVSHVTQQVYWEVDLRFMVGEYVGKDGRHRHATFGFV